MKVAIDAHALQVVSDAEAVRTFEELLGLGDVWVSELMRYRTTSQWQQDWVIEVGNWLARARSLGFLDRLLAPVLPQRSANGTRDAADQVHRNVTQQLAQAMVVHYLVGTGWTLDAYEPAVTDLRRDCTRADVDLRMCPTRFVNVDIQVKASGTLGVHDRQADAHILAGVANGFEQLPDPPLGPALIIVAAQRSWPLYADTHVLEGLIGSTDGYDDGRVLLHAERRGGFATATHVSGIVALDHRRDIDESDYGCAVLQNPWADYPLDPGWFPHARVLSCVDGVFTWLRGTPGATTFPIGTRFATASDLLERDA